MRERSQECTFTDFVVIREFLPLNTFEVNIRLSVDILSAFKLLIKCVDIRRQVEDGRNILLVLEYLPEISGKLEAKCRCHELLLSTL